MDPTPLYHPAYGTASSIWQAIGDVCAGGRVVKAAGITYLPMLGGETKPEYDVRKGRAVFFNATKRTREALVGMLMRKPPKVEIPKEAETYAGDIDLGNATIKNWVRTVTQEAVSTGRGVTIADYSTEEDRPYLAFYPAVDCVNWGTRRTKGRVKLSLLIVRERMETANDAKVECKDQFRQYFIPPPEEPAPDGTVIAEGAEHGVWVKVWTPGTDSYVEGTATALLRKGKPVMEIPAVFHNANHLGPDIGEAPLLDVADLNLAHYNGSADLENGRHITGLPTPYATGVDSGTELKLGSTKAWTTTDPEAKFGFLEFQGAGLKELVTGQEEKERQMAVLGARLLFDNKKDAESYETVRLRSVSETATLANISGYLTATLTQALRWFLWWDSTVESPADLDPKFGVVVNDDFVDTPMTSEWLTALVAALQGNAISAETFFFQCEKGELYPEGWDMQKEIAAITQRPPSMTPPAPPAPAGGKPGDPDPKPDPKKTPPKAD